MMKFIAFGLSILLLFLFAIIASYQKQDCWVPTQIGEVKLPADKEEALKRFQWLDGHLITLEHQADGGTRYWTLSEVEALKIPRCP